MPHAAAIPQLEQEDEDIDTRVDRLVGGDEVPPVPGQQISIDERIDRITGVGQEPTRPPIVARPGEVEEPPPTPEAPATSIAGRIKARLFGEDVEEDPAEFVRLGTTMALATAGVVGGFQIGSKTPPLGPLINPVTGAVVGTITGAITGAFAGAVFPERAMELAEILGLLPPGTRDELGLTEEELSRVATGEVLVEAATLGLASLPRIVGKSFIRAAGVITPEARKLASSFKAKFGVELDASRLSENPVFRMFSRIAGGFPLLGAGPRAAERRVAEQSKEALTGAAFRIGAPMTVPLRSLKIFRAAKNLVRETFKGFNEAYGVLRSAADEIGFRVAPVFGKREAISLIKRIDVGAPSGEPREILVAVREFLDKNIVNSVEDLTFTQVDELIKKIDDFAFALEGKQSREAISILSDVRSGLKLDIRENAFGASERAVKAVINRLENLDKQFSRAMKGFETTTAQKFLQVEKRGLTGVGVRRATRTPISELFDIAFNSNSFEAMTELRKLTGPKLFNDVVASVIDDARKAATVLSDISPTTQRIEIDFGQMRRAFGLDDVNSNRFAAMRKALQLTGGSIEDLDEILKVVQQAGNIEGRDVASFITRRVTLGGGRAFVSAMIPLGLAGAGGAATAGEGAGFAGMVIGIATIYGIRLFGKAISDPRNVLLFKDTFNADLGLLKRRAASIRLFRSIIQSSTDLTPDEQKKQIKIVVDLINQSIDQLTGKPLAGGTVGPP